MSPTSPIRSPRAGFEPPSDADAARPLRLRGRLSHGFAVDAVGNASFLRLEQAEIVSMPEEAAS